MDYLVQVLTRYRMEFSAARSRERSGSACSGTSRRRSTPRAWAPRRVSRLALTDFRGAAELGFIAGGGLLLCLLADT
jgi:hypothetical protein